MKKMYSKVMLALALASVGTVTPAFAADVVQTNKVWLSGATHIYGRMNVSGIATSTIKEQGFCYSSTNTNPTVEDATTKVYLSNNGNIYNMSGLQPATVYYIRAYVMKKNGTVVYGNPVKAITRPGGGITYSIEGFSGDANTRIQSAAKEAINLWNEYTGINGLHISIHYGAGTPTADCSYGGWMRVGPNASYQRTGTLLHEMLHAIGVGTIGTWQNNAFLRANTTHGYWLGSRVTRALRFWDNNPTSQLNGDGTHMWPYGVNGAHEDNGTQNLYVANSLLAEALGEDGLAPTSGQFATPAYVFEQDDNTKYYLKNEELGISSKFLRIDKSGNLQWVAMSADEATANDSAAWNVTFDPATCYYSLKNVATGRYMTYGTSGNNGIKTKITDNISAKEQFHLLPSPVEVATLNGEAKHGYWIGNVTSNRMNCLTAQETTRIKANALNFSAAGGAQRWLILTGDEAKQLTATLRVDIAKKVSALLDKMEALLDVPHKEVKEGTDATFKAELEKMKAEAETASADRLEELEDEANTALRNFLGDVVAASADEPFDISFLLQNAGMDAADGWSMEPTLNYSCGEFYQRAYDMNQKLTKMPVGVYELKVQAFQRPGSTTAAYQDYQAGKNNVDAFIYLGNVNNKQNICHIMDGAQQKKLMSGKEASVGNQYVPDDMASAAKYFAAGIYENSVKVTTKYRVAMTIGMKSEKNTTSSWWSICDNFRLDYYGAEEPSTGIQEVTVDKAHSQQGIYTLGGQLVKKNGKNLSGLPQGIYIVDGKKVVVK